MRAHATEGTWRTLGGKLSPHRSQADAARLVRYAAGVERGAATSRRLLEAQGRRLRHVRPPNLRTGDTADEHAP